MDTLKCTECQKVLPCDGKVRRRAPRPRRCKECRNADAKRKRLADPVALLSHRWRTNAIKNWPSIGKYLYKRPAVRRVWERWGGKSVISGETDWKLLCIVPFAKHDKEHPPALNDLVVVTSKEAQRMGKLAGNARAEKFPQSIQDSFYSLCMFPHLSITYTLSVLKQYANGC